MPIVTRRPMYRHFTFPNVVVKVSRPRRLATRLWKFLMYDGNGKYLDTCLNTEIRKDKRLVKKIRRGSKSVKNQRV